MRLFARLHDAQVERDALKHPPAGDADEDWDAEQSAADELSEDDFA